MRDEVETPIVVCMVMKKPWQNNTEKGQKSTKFPRVCWRVLEDSYPESSNPENSDQEDTDNKEEESEVIDDNKGKEEEQKKTHF